MRLSSPTKVCKICFKEYRDFTLLSLLRNDISYCRTCLNEIRAKFIKFKVKGYKALAIYEYDSKIQSLLYQFKGCFDVELRDVFIGRFVNELRLRYFDYALVPIPSYYKDDEKREFNHVEEMFKTLKLPMLKILVKTKNVKQATSQHYKRKQMKKYLDLCETPNLSNKKILIVDDVYTTGSTMKSAIDLIRTLKPKTIEVLVMSKTKIR